MLEWDAGRRLGQSDELPGGRAAVAVLGHPFAQDGIEGCVPNLLPQGLERHRAAVVDGEGEERLAARVPRRNHPEVANSERRLGPEVELERPAQSLVVAAARPHPLAPGGKALVEPDI